MKEEFLDMLDDYVATVREQEAEHDAEPEPDSDAPPTPHVH